MSAYVSGHHVHTGGHVTEMRTFAQRVEAIAQRLGDVPLQIAAQCYLAAASHLSARGVSARKPVENARACADRAVTLARGHGERGYEAWALRLLGELAAYHARPNVATAATHYGAAMTLASELEMRPLVAHCHRGLGMLYAATGQREPARTTLSTAIAMYQSMDMTFWLPQTETALAQVDA